MINFNFGKKKPDKKQLIVVGVILSTIIASLSQCTGVSENGLWDLLDEMQRKYFPNTIVGQIILQDPDKVKRRVERDVDKAVDDYWKKSGLKKAEVYKPIYIEKEVDEKVCYTDDCKSLGGEIRLCGPWVPGCQVAKEEK